MLVIVCCSICILSGSAAAKDAAKPAALQSDTMQVGSVMLPSAFLDQTVRVSKSDGGALIFVDPKGKMVVAERTGDRFKAEFWVSEAFALASKWVFSNGQPIVIEGGSSEVPEGLKPIPDFLQSYLGYPIKQGDKVVGVLNLVRMYGKDNYSKSDMEVIELLVAQSSDVVESIRQQSARDLMQKGELAAKTKVYFAPEEMVIREKSATLEIGLDIIPISLPMFYSDTIGKQGMSIGLMLPIEVPHALVWYRVKALFHSTNSYYGKHNYITGVNEIIGGKALRIKALPLEYTPVIGIGFNNGIILQNMFQSGFKGTGVHYYWHYNIGVVVREQYHAFSTRFAQGGMINFERAFVYDDNPKMRISISLIMSH
ncbi:MAG: GAF domain-containing protein [Chitinispirillaceae bacterium]|nr:GAF domain-containing protein [Chitinispirillaceae bacterium]